MTTPPMIRQSQILREIAGVLVRHVPGPWDRLELRVMATAPVATYKLTAHSAAGLARTGPPRAAAMLARDLRPLMYRPGAGTWFAMELIVFPDGRAASTFNYDDEPVSNPPFGPASYLKEQQKFPRDPEHQPEWYRERLAQGALTTEPAHRIGNRLTLMTTGARSVLASQVRRTGRVTDPEFAALFESEAPLTDGELERIYARVFPLVFPGVTVLSSETVPPKVSRITLTGAPTLLKQLASLPWCGNGASA